MNYHKYYPVDVVNGPGTRCTLFVSGCIHQCRGCYNQSTWNPNAGHVFDQAMVEQIIHDLKDTRIKRRGLSLSGGDPLHPENRVALTELVKRVKAECPEKDIWLWTGFVMEDMNSEQQALVNLVDVVIDGKFEQALANPSLKWRGSANQLIYRKKINRFELAQDLM